MLVPTSRQMKTESKTSSSRTASRGAAAVSDYTPTSETPTAKKRRRRMTMRLCGCLCLRAAATSPLRCSEQQLEQRRFGRNHFRGEMQQHSISWTTHLRFLSLALSCCSLETDILRYVTLHPTCFYILWIFINVHQNPFDAVTTNCRPRRRLLSVVDEFAQKPSIETLQLDIFAFLCHMPYSIGPHGQCDVYIHEMSMCLLLLQSPLNLNICCIWVSLQLSKKGQT